MDSHCLFLSLCGITHLFYPGDGAFDLIPGLMVENRNELVKIRVCIRCTAIKKELLKGEKSPSLRKDVSLTWMCVSVYTGDRK